MTHDPETLAAVLARFGDTPVVRLRPDEYLLVVLPDLENYAALTAIAGELGRIGLADRAVVLSGNGIRIAVVPAPQLADTLDDLQVASAAHPTEGDDEPRV